MLTPAEQEHFDARGFVRVRAAFTATEAEAMRDVVWRALERDGIQRDDRTTWTVEAPSHLQDLKAAQAFRAIASARTDAAIDALLGSGNWRMPKDWGAFFVLFPTDRPWTVPTGTWHLDHPYTAPLTPLRGLKVHAMFGDVEPRAGGMTIIAGSHRVVARFFRITRRRRALAPRSCDRRLWLPIHICGTCAPRVTAKRGSRGSPSAKRKSSVCQSASSSSQPPPAT